MQLLTDELRQRLLPLYSQEAEDNPVVHCLCPTEHKQCYVPAAVM
jgi:hypothetical protein